MQSSSHSLSMRASFSDIDIVSNFNASTIFSVLFLRVFDEKVLNIIIGWQNEMHPTLSSFNNDNKLLDI